LRGVGKLGWQWRCSFLISARVKKGNAGARPSPALPVAIAGRKEALMKKLLLFLLVLLFAAGYVACGKSYSSPTSPSYVTPSPGNPPQMTPTPPY
jgi:hypothetical protein